MYKCHICNREFNKKKALTSHINHHNPEYKKKSMKGYDALNSDMAKKARAEYWNNKKYNNWKEKNYSCRSCGAPLEYPNKRACNDECYSLYRSASNVRTKSDETKKLISEKLKDYMESIGRTRRM